MRATPIALCSLTTLTTGCFTQIAVAEPIQDAVVNEDTAPDETATAVAQPVAIAPPETTSVENSAPDFAVATEPVSQPTIAASLAPDSTEVASPVEHASEADSNPEAAISRSAADLLPPTQAIAQTLPANGVQPAGLTPDPNNPEEPTPEPLDPTDTNAELGNIQILPRPPQQAAPRRQPDIQLLLRSAVFTSSNITALDAFKPGDTVFSNTALLLATPQLGPTTRLVAAAGGGAVRFATAGDSNYNLLDFNVGVQQRLAPGMYTQLGWSQDQLYRDGSGQRLLLENAVDLTVGRQDQLAKHLRLDTFYNLRASFANPNDQSRVANSLGARLRYDFTPNFQGALDYRLTCKDFTQVDRFDTEHQISAIATYSINPNLFVAGTVSYLFGKSSNAAIDPNNFSAGITIGLNLPLL